MTDPVDEISAQSPFDQAAPATSSRRSPSTDMNNIFNETKRLDPYETRLPLVPQRSSTESFIHEPLDYSKQTLRLLRVHPDISPDGLVQCEVCHATVEAEYTCLSYVWGHPEPAHTILLNGKPYRIGPNLFDFLDIAKQKYPLD